MIITSGQGITPKQLEENSVIRRAETHKINSTFKNPTFFQNATDGAYTKEVYIDGASVYSTPTNPDSNTIENAIHM